MEPTAIAVTLGVELMTRTAPKGVAWLKTYAKGVEILILGPSGAGKTRFAEYLADGVLEVESRHMRTLDVTKSPTFAIKMGRDQALELRVRRSVDVIGQANPLIQANHVKERRPHCVLLVLNCQNTVKRTKKWVGKFCDRLDTVFREDDRLRRKVSSICVAINKRDKITRQSEFGAREKAVRESLVNGLKDVLGQQRITSIPIMPCVSVQTDQYGSTLIDAVIRTLARQVAS